MERFVRLAGFILLLVGAFSQDVFALTIPEAKLLPDNSSVILTAKAVTYASANVFYIEEDSRCMGIRVEKTAHGLAVGMRADVSGTMKTNTNRERYILASGAVHNGDGVLAPVGMNNTVLGGGDWQVVGTGGQCGVAETNGLNSIGLLVRTWGHFQSVNATTFTVDDGSGYSVKCTVPAGTFLYSGWQYVVLAGISSLYKLSQYPYPTVYPPVILVRDIQTVPGESVSVPGTPSGSTISVVTASYTYSTGSTCSWGHSVEYSFDWGDGTSSPWSTSTSASHSWSALGTKTVTVTARCQVHTSISASSAGLPVDVIADPFEMIYIPAGSFLMGNNGSEFRVRPDELPQHSITLSGYYIGKCEVTRGEYRQFMNAGGYSTQSNWSTDGWSWKVSNSRTEPDFWAATQTWRTGQTFTQTDNHPVVGVSYYEAEAFCNWAGGRLPTEAQWERAARWNPSVSHANAYPWGDVWYLGRCNDWHDSLYPGAQTAPVGSYSSYASPSGCEDMGGNALEWCKDWYGGAYYSESPASDPQGPANGSYRVLRGGSWASDSADQYTRCAFRYDVGLPYTGYGSYGWGYGDGWNNYGFRLAR